ncbi:MAG: hypothetical protein PHW82_01980 [Bacteroidales bacterium]|nr:hypothetical protein [Bacteroidales bacterium]
MSLKHLLFSTTISLIALSLVAQTRYVERQDPYLQFVNSTPINCDFPPNTKTVILEETYLKTETNYVKNLDEFGRVYEFHTESQNSKEHITYTCGYGKNKASTGTYTVYSSTDKIDFVINHENNEVGKPIRQITKDGKGKQIEKVIWQYNDAEKIVNSKILKGDKEELVNEWQYSYDNEGNLEKIVLIDSKGRTEHDWLYNCEEEKKSVTKIKATTQICSWNGEDGEYYTVNEQLFDEKGGYTHHIWRYSKKDSTICAYLIYDETKKLVLKEEYDHDYKKPLMIKKYNKGNVDNKGVYKYTDELMTNYSEYDAKNILIKHHLYIYNDEGFMTRARIYDDKNKNETTIVIKHR